MGFFGNLTFRFVLFCFVNMLSYGISSVLLAPFSLKTILDESTPAGARLVQQSTMQLNSFV